jgi:hypothetical protein
VLIDQEISKFKGRLLTLSLSSKLSEKRLTTCTLKIEAGLSSEMSVNIYKLSWRNITEYW